MKNEPLKRKKILVTGGFGFIGSNLCLKLLEQGADVTVFNRRITADPFTRVCLKGIIDKVRIVYGDITEFSNISQAVKNMDYIFALAGQVSPVIAFDDPFYDLDVNVKGSLNLLESCRRFNDKAKIIFSATRGQFGKPIYLPVNEKHPDNPIDVQGIHKLAAEKYFKLYHDAYNMKTCSLRLCNIYGPRQNFHSAALGAIAVLIWRTLKGEPITIYGNGSSTRDYVYIGDVCDAFVLTAQSKEADGESFLISSGEELSLNELVKRVFNISGKETEVKYVDPPINRLKTDIQRFVGSYKKINKAVGWFPKTSLQEGIAKTLEFFTEHIDEFSKL